MTKKLVVENLTLPLASTVIYTVPALTTSQIVAAVATNKDLGTNTNFTVWVNDGAGLRKYINAREVVKAGTDLCPELVRMGLEAGAVINANASIADDINFKLTIIETT